MTRERIIERYAQLILGPAGLDELAFAGPVVILAANSDSPLCTALVEAIDGAGGYPFSVTLAGLAEAMRPRGGLEPPSLVVLKSPDLIASGGAGPAPSGWPHKQLVAPCPTESWAERVFPGSTASLEMLWQAVARACRLDEDDPDGAWHRRHAALGERIRLIEALELDALCITDSASDTDLTVGLLAGSKWQNGRARTDKGAGFVPNLPCEEIFTAPDPGRVSGRAQATRPLRLGDTLVEGIELEFEEGTDARVSAKRGGQELAAHLTGPGALRLGEIALVDRHSRVGGLGIDFQDTLMDENGGCHFAFGIPIPGSYDPDGDDSPNQASLHTDIVIGTPATDVTGITREGREIPLLRAGEWQGPLALDEGEPHVTRIPSFVAALGSAWRQAPQLRFGQVLNSAVPGFRCDMGLETTSDQAALAALRSAGAGDAPADPAAAPQSAEAARVLRALETCWQQTPHLRLGQLSRRVARRAGRTGPGQLGGTDELWLEGFRRYGFESHGHGGSA